MPYRDDKLALSKSQALTADADSTYYIDTELTTPVWNKGLPACVVITIEAQSVASTGISFEIVQKVSEPTTSDAELCSATALAADLAKNAEIVVPLPRGITLLRYLRVYYNLTNGAERYTLSAYFNPLPM